MVFIIIEPLEPFNHKTKKIFENSKKTLITFVCYMWKIPPNFSSSR